MCPTVETPETELFRCFKETRPVNAKAKLIMMSRRPFSEMFKDINYAKKQEAYKNVFESLRKSLQLDRIKDSDYGRKFNRDISEVFTDLPEKYVELAKVGILAPSMVHFLKEGERNSLVAPYLTYDKIIDSVQNPVNCGLILYRDAKIVHDICGTNSENKYDLLSPPVLLATSPNDQKLTDGSHRDVDSMGHIKKTEQSMKQRSMEKQ